MTHLDNFSGGARSFAKTYCLAFLFQFIYDFLLVWTFFYMKQPLKLDYLWAGLCLVGAVYFMFREALPQA
jgi:uncharacterized protein (DUF486 family)